MQKAFLFLFACIPLFSFAQDDPFEWYSPIREGKARVISTNGLNLRSGPGTQYSRVMAIPLGAWLDVVKADRSHPDSLSPIVLHRAHEDWVIARKGFWVEVSYKGRKGYMLDIFLIESEHEEHREKRQSGSGAMAGEEKEDVYYHLSRPPASSANNFEFRKLNWYGLYEREPGEYELRKIELTQFACREAMPSNFITPMDIKDLRYVLGSSSTMKEHSFSGLRHEGMAWRYGISLNPFQEDWETAKSRAESWGIYPSEALDREYYYQKGASIFVEGNPRRELKRPFPGGAVLNFAGDLDGDERLDYILTFEGDYESYSVLYLSSEAGAGKPPVPVAEYYSGPCC